jgi:hypothetical protein
MSYYALPKKQNACSIQPTYDAQAFPHISFSLIRHIELIKEQITFLKNAVAPEYDVDLIYKSVNPCEFVHNKVPSSKFSVSKIKASSPLFYTFMEIINTFNIFEPFNGRDIVSLHCGENNDATMECMNIFRENYNDCNYVSNSTIGCELESVDFLYFEIDELRDNLSNSYTINKHIADYINALMCITMYQKANGTCILRVDSLFLKPIVEIVYLLTSMYEKVFIIKPSSSNVFTNERFLVCKNFTSDYSKNVEYNNSLTVLNNVIKEMNSGNNLNSLLSLDLPYYFINKIEESNIIIGQQQLEYLDNVINTIKNKNREDKIETLKKNNIQKCIQWCEKNKIPYNKFIDKLNIFLPIFPCNEVTEDVERDSRLNGHNYKPDGCFGNEETSEYNGEIFDIDNVANW